MESIPDWKLPPGTDRGLWDYLQNRSLAEQYDQSLRETPLLQVDLRFCEQVFPVPGKLIDLGCGTGRLLHHFGQRGFEGVGVDLSPGMLDVAREKCRGLPVQFVQANLVELQSFPDQEFDYAACLFSTLGMIRTRRHRRSFLQQVRRILKPSGKFVLHVHNRTFQLWTPGGIRWSLAQSLKRLRGRESGDRTMPQKFGGAELTLHHFSRREIRRDLREAGFEVQKIQPISTQKDGRLSRTWLLSGWRAYGYLIVAG
jgi:ubiquinone/menaquinone biosynthesis C-methylase UbiE